ncbi:Major facilitator superfamily domain, general substrate transporter [Penicillium occitanis (nom. inval.)]|nr:Major facilitator superfamily domain, general substrate transporter [Penicillium occitanis (nom. inval.)]PCH06761.1 hypothetical protein PENOC_022680 [Penicillium occitanis (nom. inval.)]
MTSMAVASLLAGLDATAVSTAMPSIIHDLGTSQGYMWIANAYLLTTAAFTPIFGQTANIFGRRALTFVAAIIFALGSAIAGPAPSSGALVTGRAIQGIGCAGINAMVEMVVCDLVPLRERGKFMGFIFAIYAISTTIGPIVGALVILENHLALVLGLVGLPLFLLYETRVPEPTTPLRLYSNRTSFVGLWCAFIHNMLVFWIIFVLPIYFQAVLRFSAFRSGISILPTAAVCMPFTIISGGIMSKIGRYRPLLMAGFALFPIALGRFTRLDEHSTTGYWAGIQIIGALAIGIIIAVTLPTILTPLPESNVAVATATWAFMRGFGTIWGVAIPLAIFNSKVDSLTAAHLQGNDKARDTLSNGGAYTLSASGFLYPELGLDGDPDLEATVKSIYVDSLKLCWQVGLGFALLGFLLTFVAKELHMRTELETEFGLENLENESNKKEQV